MTLGIQNEEKDTPQEGKVGIQIKSDNHISQLNTTMCGQQKKKKNQKQLFSPFQQRVEDVIMLTYLLKG